MIYYRIERECLEALKRDFPKMRWSTIELKDDLVFDQRITLSRDIGWSTIELKAPLKSVETIGISILDDLL